jgi:signal transduction histidine kinase/CheY-like chemotaxis protein
MAADIPTVPMPETLLERRIALDQIDALFNAITVSVCGGAIAAGVLVAALLRLGAVDAWTGLVWSSYIVFCAAGHILLCRAYRRSRPEGNRWRAWALWFTVISFAEGIGWGWASIGLATATHSDAKHLVFLIVGGVAAATIPGFSPYLPAFLALFLPATLGALVASILSVDPVQQAAFPVMLVFVGAVGALGVKANQGFKQLSGLRIRTEILAQDLQRQKEIAEQASLAKSTFLAAASHDLRQPVHAMGLFVGALRSVPMPPQGQRLLEQLELSINAMDGLFSAILDISRLDARIVEVHRRCFAIGPLLDRICRDYEEEARVKELSLTRRYSSVIVESDPVLVERILRNLISNAVRYTSQGRIVVGCRRRGATVLVQVWDTGRGIPADQQDRVFQEYYQLDNPERDRTKGLGLGLAIVRRLTELLDCKLRLRSQPGRGSCFEVTFPLAGDTTGVIELQPQAFSGVLAQGLIIVIDDELAIRQAMSSLLTGWGYNVVAAGSGEEAIQVLSRFPAPPDLVICDYRLRNGENGIEVIARLRSEFNEAIPAMLITGDTAPDRLAEAKASGLLLLHKPLSNAKLRAAIVNLARKTEPNVTTVA